ncbi:siroheme synthase [Candidatus Poribacteria bacterium]|nr:siroheme synthase [Candidatus Poribacteria bacterium]
MFPAMLRMDDVDTLVVGGGPVAARRAGTLVKHGARVSVVSPSLCDDLRRMVDSGTTRWHARPYERGDAEGRRLVVAATDSCETNAAIADAARAAGAWVNVADDASLGDLHFPAATTRGRLTIAVATDGVSPLVSRRIRERVETEYGDEFAGLLDLLADAREEARDRIDTQPARRRFYEDVLNSDARDSLRAGRPNDARARVSEILADHAGRQA